MYENINMVGDKDRARLNKQENGSGRSRGPVVRRDNFITHDIQTAGDDETGTFVIFCSKF